MTRLKKTLEFAVWLEKQDPRTAALVEMRLDRIQTHAHFGKSRALGDGLFELKWDGGLRVYFGYIALADGNAVLMLLGGTKNG